MVEDAGKGVSHGGRGLDHKHENEVEGDELAKGVGEADGEVRDEKEDQWDDGHDGDLGYELGRRVHPDVVHA